MVHGLYGRDSSGHRERERGMTHKAFEMRVPVGRERRISLLRVWASRLRPLGKAIVWENSPIGSRVRVGQIW